MNDNIVILNNNYVFSEVALMMSHLTGELVKNVNTQEKGDCMNKTWNFPSLSKVK